MSIYGGGGRTSGGGAGRDVSGFYKNQINEYNQNYNDSKKNIETIVSALNNLYLAFSSTSGDDIDLVKSDLNKLKGDLNDLKSIITNKMTETNDRASSCDKCFKYYLNKSYPTYVGNKIYSSGAKVTVKDDGLISIKREYTIKPNLLETLFRPRAGELYEYTTIDTSEMFNYQ